MIYVGIDVSKDKHDCFIYNSSGEILNDGFSFKNNADGFQQLLNSIPNVSNDNVRVGLESTGHYSLNLIQFLDRHNLSPIIFNPLQVNLIRKAQTLRKTKTDKIDAKIIASILSDMNLNLHSSSSYHFSELKSLCRYRLRIKKHTSQLKLQINRLVVIMFPELQGIVSSLNQKSILAMLLELPSADEISAVHLTRLTNILKKNSGNHHGKELAIRIKEAAKKSIGFSNRALKIELRQTVESLISENQQIDEIEKEIKNYVEELESPITSIPGIGYVLGAIIISELGDVNRFEDPGKILAFAGLEPGVHESGTFEARSMKMVKRGSPYLRWAILEASKQIVRHDETFKKYHEKKLGEGKHYLVSISHVARKLIRVLFKILKDNIEYQPQEA